MSEINIHAALQEVIIRIVRGERARVKQAYKDTIFEMMQADYPKVKIVVESEDKQYAYIKQVSSGPVGFTPEDLAKAMHDCNGGPIKTETGVVTGYGLQGQVMSDVTSTKCFAKQVIYIDTNKNEYYLPTNKSGGLFNPTSNIDNVRSGWVRCNKSQFDRYLSVLRTGRAFELGNIKTELQIN